MTAFIINLNLAVTPQPPVSETVARAFCHGDSLPFNGSHRFRAPSSLNTARLDRDAGLGLHPWIRLFLWMEENSLNPFLVGTFF